MKGKSIRFQLSLIVAGVLTIMPGAVEASAFASESTKGRKSKPRAVAKVPPLDEVITRLALGSCADQNRPQPIWKAVKATDPDLFLFLGDNVYADTYDMNEMELAYETLAAVPFFEDFRRSVPILASWDDHDYGWNDAGASYSKKAQSKRLLLDFFHVPATADVRQREGLYQSWIFGPEHQRVQIILLDARWFRSDLAVDPSPHRRYQPLLDPQATLLGPAQWDWLRTELRKPADFRLIASGIQVLGYAGGFESWKNLPLEQEKLFATLRETRAGGVVLLSGDAHFTQIKRSDAGLGYPLYEFTSSGLTHGNPKGAERSSPLAIARPYGGMNFGTLTFDWGEDPSITLRAHDVDGNTVFEQTVERSSLEPTVERVD